MAGKYRPSQLFSPVLDYFNRNTAARLKSPTFDSSFILAPISEIPGEQSKSVRVRRLKAERLEGETGETGEILEVFRGRDIFHATDRTGTRPR